jgi:hypothetical protein
VGLPLYSRRSTWSTCPPADLEDVPRRRSYRSRLDHRLGPGRQARPRGIGNSSNGRPRARAARCCPTASVRHGSTSAAIVVPMITAQGTPFKMTQHRPTRSSTCHLPEWRSTWESLAGALHWLTAVATARNASTVTGRRRVCSPRMTRPPAGFRRFASTIASHPRVVYLAQRRLLREVDTVNEVPTKIEIG